MHQQQQHQRQQLRRNCHNTSKPPLKTVTSVLNYAHCGVRYACSLRSTPTANTATLPTIMAATHPQPTAQLSFSPPLGQLRWQNHPGLWQLLHRVIIAAQAPPWYQANGWRLCAHVASRIPTCGERGYKYKHFYRSHKHHTHSFVTRAAASQ